MWGRVLVALVGGTLSGSCVTEPGAFCDTHEGPEVCVRIHGTVSDPSGTPLQGYWIGPRYSIDPCVCTTVYTQTDSEGGYSFWISRMVGLDPEGEVWPDTVAMFVSVRPPGKEWHERVRTDVVFGAPTIAHELNITYSPRMASTTSTRVARRPGIRLATAPTTTRSVAAAPKLKGSVGSTP